MTDDMRQGDIALGWFSDEATVDFGETDVWVWEVRKFKDLTDGGKLSYIITAQEKPLYSGLYLREKADAARVYNILAHVLAAETIESFFERHGVDVKRLREDPMYWYNEKKTRLLDD